MCGPDPATLLEETAGRGRQLKEAKEHRYSLVSMVKAIMQAKEELERWRQAIL